MSPLTRPSSHGGLTLVFVMSSAAMAGIAAATLFSLAFPRYLLRMPRRSSLSRLVFLLLPLLLPIMLQHGALAVETARAQTNSPNIHAIIVSSSRYWFNYRHAMNALGIYEVFRENGIPEENIILMLADEYASNARNPYKNRMHASGIHRPSWYSNYTEVDYRGSDVTVQVFLDALMGTAPKALHTDEDSRLVIYMTGHGGDNFFKFQDEEELTSQDIAAVMDRLYENRKFAQALFIADTCQAFTLFDKLTTPNVLAFGTSLRDQNAYGHHSDIDLGLAVIERWTHLFLTSYHEKATAVTTLAELMVTPFANKNVLAANVGAKEDTSKRKFKDIRLSEFFGSKGGAKRVKSTINGGNLGHPVAAKVHVKSAGGPKQDLAHQRLPCELERSNVLSPQLETHNGQPTMDTHVSDLVPKDDTTFVYLVILLLFAVVIASAAEKGISRAKRD